MNIELTDKTMAIHLDTTSQTDGIIYNMLLQKLVDGETIKTQTDHTGQGSKTTEYKICEAKCGPTTDPYATVKATAIERIGG